MLEKLSGNRERILDTKTSQALETFELIVVGAPWSAVPWHRFRHPLEHWLKRCQGTASKEALITLVFGFQREQDYLRRDAETNRDDARADSGGHKEVMVVLEDVTFNVAITITRRFDNGAD